MLIRRRFIVVLALSFMFSGLLTAVSALPVHAAPPAGCPGGGAGPKAPGTVCPVVGEWKSEDQIMVNDAGLQTRFVRDESAQELTFVRQVDLSNESCEKGNRKVLRDFEANGERAKFVTLSKAAFQVSPFGCLNEATQNIELSNSKAAKNLFPKPEDGDDGDDDCAKYEGGGLAWAVCPLISTIQGALDSGFKNIITPLLTVTPLSRNNGGGAVEQTYRVWSAFRNLANVGFVLVFLIIVFANALSINIDAYTIKKLLPKLVIASILVQFSFLICALMVDVGNVLGSGLGELILRIVEKDRAGGSSVGQLVAGFGVIGGLGVVGLGAFAIIAPVSILMMLIGLAIGVMAFMFSLILRQVLISTFIVLAPLAFMFWVLPNTENLFRAWYKNLFRMILVYPIIVLILGMGRVVEAAASGGAGLKTTVAVLAPTVSFLLVPIAFKMAGGAMTAVTGFIGGKAGGAKKGLSNSSAVKGLKDRSVAANKLRAAGYGFGKPGSKLNKVSTGLGRIGTGQIMKGARTKANIAKNFGAMVTSEGKNLIDPLNLTNEQKAALASKDVKTLKQIAPNLVPLSKNAAVVAAAGYDLAQTGDTKNLRKVASSLNAEVASGAMTHVQADQTWQAMTHDNFNKVLEQDRMLAFHGWNMDNHTGANANKIIAGTSGAQMAGEKADAIRHQRQLAVDEIGFTDFTVTQLRQATTGNTASKLTREHLVELFKMGMSSQHEDARLETFFRFKMGDDGTLQVRSQDEVAKWLEAYQKDAHVRDWIDKMRAIGKALA